MKMFLKFIFLYVSIVCVGNKPLEIKVNACKNAPRIDGILNDACWKSASKIDKFYIIGKDKSVNKHKVYVTCDNNWLYIAYDVAHPKNERIEPRYTKRHDDYVQRDDCVKVSFDPGTGGRMWYHFKVNRANVRNDRRFVNGKQEVQSWNIPWRSATQSNSSNWTAEIALPLCLLYPFDNLENARINLLISSNVAKRDLQGVIVDKPKQIKYSWAPLKKWFIEVKKFGHIKGLDELDLSAPFLPYIERAEVSKYFQKDNKFYYGVDIKVKPYTATAGEVEFILEDIVAQKRSTTRQKTAFPRNSGERIVKIEIPVSSLVKRSASLKMTDSHSGEILQKIDFQGKDMEAMDLFSAYLDRSYYTSELFAKVVYKVGFPPSALKGMYFKAIDSSGKILQKSNDVQVESIFKIPLDKLPVGNNKIILKLFNKQNREVTNLPLKLVKRLPNAGVEWKIDHINRVLLNNGKPFFTMGFCVHKLDLNDKETVEKITKSGFNFIMFWNKISKPEELAAYCDLMEEHNLYMMPAIDDIVCNNRPVELNSLKKYLKGSKYQEALKYCTTFTQLKCKMSLKPVLAGLPKKALNEIFEEFTDKKLPEIIKVIDMVRNRKAILSWWIFDEPQLAIFDQWRMGRKVYQKINQTDGYHPVTVNYSSHIPEMKEATDWFDILMTDPYWTPAGTVRNTPNFVSQIVSQTNKRAAERRQPAWNLLVATIWSSTRKRIISPAEQACQNYLAAINGATGILYFAYSNINDHTSWNVIAEMGKQFKVLGPACVSPKVKQQICYKSKSSSGKITEVTCNPAEQKFVDIQLALKRNPSGGYILMAANSRYYPVTAEINIKGLSGKLKSLFKDKSYSVNNGTFTDSFEAFGVRAYKIDKKLTEPVNIEITAIPPVKIPAPERAVSQACRENKKNKFCNPSFEQAAVKCWPDYYFTHFFGKRIGPYIGEPGAVCGQDDKFAKFGKYSLRVSTPAFGSNGQGRLYWFCAPQHRRPQQYTFSAWIKGNKQGLIVRMRCMGFTGEKTKRVTVNEKWRKYSFTGTIPASVNRHNMFDLSLETTGVIWIDGLQLEKGNKATEFEK